MLTHLRLENWKNFRSAEIALERRMFIVGPNAAGKSNLLDAIRFLRDVADPKGGLQRAVESHGPGISAIRSLHARRHSDVVIAAQMTIDAVIWEYRLELTQDNQRVPVVKREVVRRNGIELLDRAKESDATLLRQTHLEQVIANSKFREVANFLSSVRYAHIVPQLVRDPQRSVGYKSDPYGGDFLEQLVATPSKTRSSRMRRIKDALKVAVPQLKDLDLKKDEMGIPHVRMLYEHWRPNAGWQDERSFSDGTLRLLGLLWLFLDGSSPLLLEEPELSLHASVVRFLPQMIHRLGRKNRRQIIISTHSPELLADPGISGEEVLLLEPTREGTRVECAADKEEARRQLRAGIPASEVVMAATKPKNLEQLIMFE